MTAKELIERLEEVPGDAEVYLDYKWGTSFKWHETERELRKIFYDKMHPNEIHLSTYEYALCPDGI